MESLLPIILGLGSGALGGNIAGKVLKSGMGPLGRSLTGIVGGGGLASVLSMVGGGSAIDAAQATASSGLDITSLVKSVAGGGIGGGVLTAILGMVTGKK